MLPGLELPGPAHQQLTDVNHQMHQHHKHRYPEDGVVCVSCFGLYALRTVLQQATHVQKAANTHLMLHHNLARKGGVVGTASVDVKCVRMSEIGSCCVNAADWMPSSLGCSPCTIRKHALKVAASPTSTDMLAAKTSLEQTSSLCNICK